MVEGTPLLREHTAKNLYPGFESLRLRQHNNAAAGGTRGPLNVPAYRSIGGMLVSPLAQAHI